MASFATMKKSRKSQFENLRSKVESEKSNGGGDDRYWKPEQDKAGNGYAVIRFLQPSKKDMEVAEQKGVEAVPFVSYFRHMFKAPTGKWFVNNCPTTIGEKCPVCEANSELWNTEIPSNQDIVRKRKRQQKYVANILVVKDSANPENDGKVFLYEFGAKIFAKIESMMFPEFEDETEIDPFDFWEGANFKLKIRKVEGYTNYDKSEFDEPSAISEDDKEIERIWNESHSLMEFVDPSKYKSYDKIKGELNRALGSDSPSDTAEDHESKSAPEPSKSAGRAEPKNEADDIPFETDSDESDENIEFFQQMLDED